MKAEKAAATASPPYPDSAPGDFERDQISQNIDAVLDFYTREEKKISGSQRLLEELRRDLPNVRDRHDSEATAMQQSMNPDQVLATLDERSEPGDASKAPLAVA